MRFTSIYKKIFNTNLIFKKVPLRVYKFKRPKWKKLQLFSKKKSFSLINHCVKHVPFKKWEKIKNFYKEGLFLKRSISDNFGNVFNQKYHKKNLYILKKSNKSKNVYTQIMVKPFYMLDILLYKLNFFPSILAARQYICKKKIKVNGLYIKRSILLKKGDCIFLSDFSIISIDKQNSVIFPFLEVDYYTGTIFVLKNFFDFDFIDFSFFINKTLQYNKFLDYVRLK